MSGIRVETTQNVYITYQPGTLGDRIIAYLIDLFILVAYTILIMAILGAIEVQNTTVYLLALYLPWFFYDLICEIVLDGQSIGKRQIKLKVISLDGREASIAKYLLRWLFRPVDLLIFGPLIAIVMIISSGNGQRLGDLVAGTSVVSLKRSRSQRGAVSVPNIEEDYEPVFPEVALLSDRDIAIIKEAIATFRLGEANVPTYKAANKVKEFLALDTELPPLQFLNTIVKDYYHLSGDLRSESGF
ncbi:RDD family protein [Chondrinema litorale]|uniref:RDD family protein n=1 Tax=Chondrinema litorale TaxID=2994555 RepID=UPI002542DAA5|nr:RDD family protein [Chondrinema litorale]UZR94515.1 RDD family protein [Chondrinema litorale]